MNGTVRRVTLAALVSLVIASAVSVTWAAIGDGGIVTTCLSKAKATWRPIDASAGETCKAGEQMLQIYSKSGADSTFLSVSGKAADSDKLDGIDSTGFLGTTAKAADSEKLDGIDSTGFLGATAKAADSEKLDGIDSTGFVQGQGFYQRFVVATTNLSGSYGVPFGSIQFGCLGDPGQKAFWFFGNQSGGPLKAWLQRGTTGAMSFFGIADGAESGEIKNPDGPERWTFQLSNGSGNSAEIDIWVMFDGSACNFVVQTQSR